MEADISAVFPRHSRREYSDPRFSLREAEKARTFHSSLPGYAPSPLRSLPALSDQLGIGSIFIKDESTRFSLNAFKVLGGSYAAGRWVSELLGYPETSLPYSGITSEEAKSRLGNITFVTATDGNHGRGVAWTAARLRQGCVVYLPRGSADERVENIRALGARAEVTGMNYDDTVRFAAAEAERNGWILMQDTSSEGYEDIPLHIMQGYMTVALEAAEQLNGIKPTHVFLQAGVGSMAGAIAGFFSSVYGEERPVITIVEPHSAACLYLSAKAGDGKPHSATGDLSTCMAGLACGEPCPIAWEVLKNTADCFLSVPEYAAAYGIRILAAPCAGDPPVISGESGAAAFGSAMCLLTEQKYRAIRERLGLNSSSRLLFISTEGATDRENYRKIVWNGKLPVPEAAE